MRSSWDSRSESKALRFESFVLILLVSAVIDHECLCCLANAITFQRTIKCQHKVFEVEHNMVSYLSSFDPDNLVFLPSPQNFVTQPIRS